MRNNFKNIRNVSKARRLKKHGFSPLELATVITVIALFLVAGGFFLYITTKSAYDITAKHDLQSFGDFQVFYYKINNRCIGELGQAIRNDGVESDIKIDNYSVSEGVSITINSGSPDNPYDIDNPFTFQAKHEKSDTVFEYNFRNGQIIER